MTKKQKAKKKKKKHGKAQNAVGFIFGLLTITKFHIIIIKTRLPC